MKSSPTLYKIPRPTAGGNSSSIVVETTKPHSTALPHLLFCGGFHSSMLGNKARFLAELCQIRGWGYTRFDYQGHGQSEGIFEQCSLHDWLGDALAVIDDVTGQAKHLNTVLVGSSMGAWLASHVILQRQKCVAAFVSIAAAPDFTERLLWPAFNEQQKASIIRGESISLPSRYDDQDWRISHALIESGRELLLLTGKRTIDINMPVRMLHGTADTDVPWESSQLLLEMFTNADDATLQLIRGADHRLSDENSLKHLQVALDQVVNAID